MKPIYLILIFFLFSFSVFAQSNWRQVNTGLQDQVGGVIFQDSLVGYATIGNKILTSGDAGENWSPFYEDTTLLAYSSITLVNDSIFVIGVDTGINSQTRTFSIQLINTFSKQLREFSLSFFPKSSSILVSKSDTILILSDLGDLLGYKNGNFTVLLNNCKNFSFRNNVLFAVSNDKIFTSSNFGITWDTVPTPLYTYPISNSYYDGVDTMILSYPFFPAFCKLSNNNGVTWIDQNYDPLVYTQFINSKRFYGLRSFYSPAIVKFSVDGGFSFNSDTLVLNRSLYGIYQFSSKLAFVFGEDGLLFKSTNLGGLVGINEHQSFKESDFTIFPNPSQDYLQIKLADKDRFSVNQMTILSTNGAVLDRFDAYQDRIELSNYPKGMYIIQIQTNKGSASKSFAVK